MEEKIAEVIAQSYGLSVLLVLGLVSVLVTIVRESRKLREEVSYQVSRDLLERRFVAYGKLWSRMKLIAIYGDGKLEPGDVSKLRQTLANWYFSEHGGLFLTKRARTFYFALQNMLAKTSRLAEWTCLIRPDEPEKVFRTVLQHVLEPKEGAGSGVTASRRAEVDRRITGLLRRLEDPDPATEREWSDCCELVADYLRVLAEGKNEQAGEAIFAAIQQVSSVLRTVLASDVRGRRDIDLPAR